MTQLVSVLTIKDRAIPLIESLKEDWTKELCGVALMDIGADKIGIKIDDVTIKAGFQDFMEWVRRDALDVVYIDVPYDTGDSLAYYLVELESMGLDVHFSVPPVRKKLWRESLPGMAQAYFHEYGA